MKTKSAALVLSFTGAFAFFFSGADRALAQQDDSLQKVIDAGVLRVAAEPGTPPMLFKEGNRYEGFDYAIAKAVAKRIGVDDVVIVAGKYSDLPARLIAGKADVIISGYTADDSITGIDWSDAYLDYGLCLVVKKGRGVHSTSDLRGKAIGIFNDPAAEEEVQGMNLGQSRIEKYEDGYFELLDQGKIDGFIYDFPYAQEEIKEFAGRLEIVEFNLSKSSYNVGVRRGASTLLRMVNSAVKSLKASDEYRQIVRKYLGGTGPAPVAKVAAGQSVYKVRSGDTLSGIARDHLGNMRRWNEIWEANRNRIADPNLIDIGWELVLPGR
ncbi:MAG: transporter substrate-binding domain-containing protein [Thermoanaerobaculia bacterium]